MNFLANPINTYTYLHYTIKRAQETKMIISGYDGKIKIKEMNKNHFSVILGNFAEVEIKNRDT